MQLLAAAELSKAENMVDPELLFVLFLLQGFSAFSLLLKQSQMSLEICIIRVSREEPCFILCKMQNSCIC